MKKLTAKHVESIYEVNKNSFNTDGVVLQVTKAYREKCKKHADEMGLTEKQYGEAMVKAAEKHKQLNTAVVEQIISTKRKDEHNRQGWSKKR